MQALLALRRSNYIIAVSAGCVFVERVAAMLPKRAKL